MTATTPEVQVDRAQLPEDPVAFVAEAERGTNECDLASLEGLFAADAVYENTADGIYERYSGEEQVIAAWKAILTWLHPGGLNVKKTLLTVGEDTIVNDWQGTVYGLVTRGVEVWRFDADGKVCHHRTYSTINARPSSSIRARVRAGLNYPLLGIRMLAAQRRFGARPQ